MTTDELKYVNPVFADPIKYLQFRDANLKDVIHGYESLDHIALTNPGSPDSVRPILGNSVVEMFFQMQLVGVELLQPKVIEDQLRMARILGYYMAYPTVNKMGFDQFRTGKTPVEVVSNDMTVGFLGESWRNAGIGLINKVEEHDGSIECEINEVGCSIKALDSKYCSLCSNLCGIAEGLTGVLWSGELEECGNAESGTCKIRIHPGDEPFVKDKLEKRDYADILDGLVKSVVDGVNPYPRKELGSDLTMTLSQVVNYLFENASPGHRILYHFSGMKVGEKMAELKPAKNMNEAVENLGKIFSENKVGLLKQDGDNLILEESLMASGVKNQKPQCAYLGKIIEGCLSKALGRKFSVTETKCLAKGDDFCEFACKRI